MFQETELELELELDRDFHSTHMAFFLFYKPILCFTINNNIIVIEDISI